MSAAVLSQLSWQESRRVLLHPIAILGWALYAWDVLLGVIDDPGPRAAFTTIDTTLTAQPGLLLILAGNLVACRDRRAGTDEILAAVPVGPVARTLALHVTALLAAAAGLVAVLVAHGVHLLLDRYDVSGSAPVIGHRLEVPGVAHLLQAPITLAGAVLLGTMVARWFSARTAAAVAILAIIAANVAVASGETGQYFGPMMSWARWGAYDEAWGGLLRGSPGWHVGYLLGLCALAALGSLIVVVRRRGAILAAGVAALAATAACGVLQLP